MARVVDRHIGIARGRITCMSPAMWPLWAEHYARDLLMRLFRRRSRTDPLPVDPLLAGDLAMRERRWGDAIRHYEHVLAEHPDSPAILVQQGHALKELGQFDRAAECYLRACAVTPDDIDAHLHLAHLFRRMGKMPQAIDQFATILDIDPLHDDAYRMLVEAGARHRVPLATQRAAAKYDIADLQRQLNKLRQDMDRLSRQSTYPLTRYDAFRQDIGVAPPPEGDTVPPSIMVEIDARGIAPYFLRATLLSLLGQTETIWSARVHADEATAAHSVASLAVDPRISFDGGVSTADYILHIAAGTILNSEALHWFGYALARTGAVAAWCDFDHAVEHWRDGLRFEDPQLWGVFDPDMMAQAVNPPAAVAIAASVHSPRGTDHSDPRRAMLLSAAAAGPVAHIPRMLASVLRAPEQAAAAPQSAELAPPSTPAPLPGPVAGTSFALRAQAQRALYQHHRAATAPAAHSDRHSHPRWRSHAGKSMRHFALASRGAG